MSNFKWGTKNQRKAIIEKINAWALDLEATVTLLGDDPTEFAPAIVAVTDTPQPSVIYSGDKVIRCLMRSSKMTADEAAEWYDYNTVRGVAYLPKDTNPPQLVTEIDDVLY
jgi:hypothetical protein